MFLARFVFANNNVIVNGSSTLIQRPMHRDPVTGHGPGHWRGQYSSTSTHHLPGLVGPPPTDEQSRDASGPWAAVGARPEVRLSPRDSAPLNFFSPRRIKMSKGPGKAPRKSTRLSNRFGVNWASTLFPPVHLHRKGKCRHPVDTKSARKSGRLSRARRLPAPTDVY